MDNKSFFNHFIEGLDDKAQAYLNLYFTRELMKDQFIRRAEIEKLKNEITEEVLSRVRIRLEAEALEELRDLLKNLDR